MHHSDYQDEAKRWWLQDGVMAEQLVNNKLTQLVKFDDKDCPWGVVSGTICGSTILMDDIVAFTTIKSAYQYYRHAVRSQLRYRRIDQELELSDAQSMLDRGDTIGAAIVLMGEKPACKMCEETVRNGLANKCRNHLKVGEGITYGVLLFVMVNSLSLLPILG